MNFRLDPKQYQYSGLFPMDPEIEDGFQLCVDDMRFTLLSLTGNTYPYSLRYSLCPYLESDLSVHFITIYAHLSPQCYPIHTKPVFSASHTKTLTKATQ